jgi:hypothetical protein
MRKNTRTIRGGAVQADWPSRIRAYMQTNLDTEVVKMTLARKPIESSHMKLLNAISLGKLSKNMDKMSYDELFHLSFELELSNGDFVRAEKNHVLQVFKYNQNRSDSAHVTGAGLRDFISRFADKASKTDYKIITARKEVSFNKPLLFNDFLENGRKLVGSAQFFSYSALTNNCQSFVSSVLKGNDLYTEENRKFVVQSAKSLVVGFEFVEKILQGITDAGAFIDRLIH